jgi:sugar phosphate isomerase/epimerase
MKVSFDFDGTLETADVQKYAGELVKRGVEVWIVTTRYDQRAEQLDPDYFRMHAPKCWEDVFEIADKLGIKRENIVFTCYKWKHTYFENHSDFAFHLDDNYQEEYDIKVPFVLVKKRWKQKCEKLMKKDFEGL